MLEGRFQQYNCKGVHEHVELLTNYKKYHWQLLLLYNELTILLHYFKYKGFPMLNCMLITTPQIYTNILWGDHIHNDMVLRVDDIIREADIYL